MEFKTRSLSAQESRVVLALRERGQREVTRADIVKLLGASLKAADKVIGSLRRKGWLERAAWGEYLLVPPEQGPDALGDSNLLALASRIANPYYIGFSSAAAHYGLTTQHRNVIFLVTPEHLRARRVGEAQVRIVNSKPDKFFGFDAVDVLGYKVMISDREKTAIELHRPDARTARRDGRSGPSSSRPRPAGALTGPKRPTIWSGSIRQLWSGGLPGLWITSRPICPPKSASACSYSPARGPRTWLGPNPARAHTVPGAIGYDNTWRLFVNVTREELHGSAGLGLRKSIRKDS